MVDCARARAAVLGGDRGEGLAAPFEKHLASCAACQSWHREARALERALGGLSLAYCPASALDGAPPFERVARGARAAARQQRRRRVLRRVLPGALAVACAVAATIGFTRLSQRPDEAVVASGQIVDALGAPAQALLAGGGRLTVASGRARVDVSEPRRSRIHLESGSAFLSVPHLEEGASFVLTTDEAEVRVRGTRFDVTRDARGTRVSVTEGRVEVRSFDGSAPLLLERGESSLVESRDARRQAARASALGSIDQRDDSTTAARIQAWLATEPPAEEAAEAHALLGWKLSRDGDRTGALQSYERALALLPAESRPLWADNACAQRARLLEREDAQAGSAAWRGYLERFPDGAHTALARDRIARTPAQEQLTSPGR